MIYLEYNILQDQFHFNAVPEITLPNRLGWLTIGIYFDWDYLIYDSERWEKLSQDKRRKILFYLFN